MNIILLKDLDKVGDQYQTVKVKDGYARNYLIPQGIAVVANDSNTRKFAAINRSIDKKESARLGEYQAIAQKLDGKTVKITAKAGTSGKLFGSVDAIQIAAAIKEQLGVEIERKRVVCEPLKEVGTHIAAVVLHKEVSAQVTVEISAVGESKVAADVAKAPVVNVVETGTDPEVDALVAAAETETTAEA
jgi:large subunit ribosomal protein L9